MSIVKKPSRAPSVDNKYNDYVNPEWVKLLSVLGLNTPFIRSLGCELTAENGDVYLDFLSGYGVYNAGHNHPYIRSQLIEEINSLEPTMLQSHVPRRAAELAERLCSKAGGRIGKAFFTSSGSEGIESAIKFSRAHTKRDWILYAEGAFHGLTCGALSLMSNSWWREGFGNLLTETQAVPFGDIVSLRRELAKERYAALVLEPVQGESGVVVPTREYLKEAQRLCDLHGTLLVIDEVQTGVHRTGPFLASHHFGISPDMIVMAKALSGGYVPVGALLTRSDINASVYSSVEKSFVHASTFGENALAMRAALATLDVMENEKIEERCKESGDFLRQALSESLSKYEIVSEVRGLGLMNGIVFKEPESLTLRMFYKSFARLHEGLFGQMVVSSLFNNEKVLSQMAGNNYQVIKSMPPLTISRDQLERYMTAVVNVCEMITYEKTRFWMKGISIATRTLAAKVTKLSA